MQLQPNTMTKYLLIPLLGITLLANPLFHKTTANADGWVPVAASGAWEYGEYRVERVAETDVRSHLHDLGDAVVMSRLGSGCALRPCGQYHVTQFKNGAAKLYPDVPAAAVNEQRFADNGNRFVYLSPSDQTGNRFDVVERNLETGTMSTLVEDASFSGVYDLDVRVYEDQYFFNQEFNFGTKNNPKSYRQAAVLKWDAQADRPDPISPRWRLNHEDLQDVHGDRVLLKMVFESGHKQLWVINKATDNRKPLMTPVPGTWTEPHADIYGAHFLADGTVEYFQYFTRYTYHPDVNDEPVRHESEKLNWYRDPSLAYQMVNNRLAWIDPDNQLRVSTTDGVIEVGPAYNGIFTLSADRLTYATANPEGPKSVVLDLVNDRSTMVPLHVTDSMGDRYVGLDEQGQVVYFNASTNQRLTLGFGATPVLSDDSHVYWKGVDGAVYEGTILPTPTRPTQRVRALKSVTSAAVHLVSDGKRWIIPNEHVYFAWFDSWNAIEIVSDELIQTYDAQGVARFPVGTKVKEAGRHQVYVVGTDGKLHWITSQALAYKIYGSTWNHDVLEVPTSALIDYPQGSPIQTEGDLARIK